jgi:hypothetical protein
VSDLDVARRLEQSVRAPFVDDQIDIHILGFAKAVGDIAEVVGSVVAFSGATAMITAVLSLLGALVLLAALACLTDRIGRRRCWPSGNGFVRRR